MGPPFVFWVVPGVRNPEAGLQPRLRERPCENREWPIWVPPVLEGHNEPVRFPVQWLASDLGMS